MKESREAGRGTEEPSQAAEGHGARPAEDSGEMHPGAVLKQIKAGCFKDKRAVEVRTAVSVY